MRPVDYFRILFIIVTQLDQINGQRRTTIDLGDFHPCFCQSINEILYLGQVHLSSCDIGSSEILCDSNKFSPEDPLQLLKMLQMKSSCWNPNDCVRLLPSVSNCQRCHLHNETVSLTAVNRTCFLVCPNDPSCSFICFHRSFLFSIDCDQCDENRPPIKCRCIYQRKSPLTRFVSTEKRERWMEKRGVPAAAILAVLVSMTLLLTLLIKQIYRQIDIIRHRRDGILRHSVIPNCNESQDETTSMHFSRRFFNSFRIPHP